MSSDIAVVSVTTRNYLYRARVLFDSVAEFLPEAKRLVCCADSLETAGDVSCEPFGVLEASSLGVPRFDQWALALNATALCCALKPHAIKVAMRDPEVRRVIYVDNDVALYRRPDEMLAALDRASLALTPHHLKPLPEGSVPSEETLVRYGTFNAGIFGVRRSEESDVFLDWWTSWMLDPRHLEKGAGYDQVWLNYAPVYCPSMAVLRDRTYNVAFWNLRERHLSVSADGSFLCGNDPLTAFHFSNFSEENPEDLVWPRIFSNHVRTGATDALIAGIMARWREAGRAQCLGWGYGFAKWPDRKEVTVAERNAATSEWDAIPADADPWNSAKTLSNERMLKMVRSELVRTKSKLCKLWLRRVLRVSPLEIIRKMRSIMSGERQPLTQRGDSR